MPSIRSQVPIGNPIDAFVLEKLDQARLNPAGPASPLELLRRVYFDLIGLPPTPEDIAGFRKDHSPRAYRALIDRLLDSPQYGERWARHWLDVVRYADTGGSETDLLFHDAWKYRDYVIRSLHADKPFDRFIQEQVAGDELWPDDPDAVTATAMYCLGPVLEESAMMGNQLEYEWLTDAADTTGAAFLGMTLGCARCHNHKYDPISQKDYFAMQALFAASDRVYPDAVREKRIKSINGLLAEKPLPEGLRDDPRCLLKTEKEAGFHLVHRQTPMEVRLLRRGELSKAGEVVEPALLSVFAAGHAQRSCEGLAPGRRRTVLAQWLTYPDENPVAPRVIVNRVWAWHFGQGLVRTPNDFGTQGEPPTHPELLDWLARDFIAHGWSLKHLHRQILLSDTYARQTLASPGALQMDPENRLWSHQGRRRLEGEEIWDSLHWCAGTLNPKPFGPPVVPGLSPEELTGLFDAKAKWQVTADPAEHTRRGLYVFVRRTYVFPMFDAFDPPDLTASCARRLETTVPAQALTLLNSRAVFEQSQAFARRLMRECGPSPNKLLKRAWLIAFNRPITRPELSHARVLLRELQTQPAKPRPDSPEEPAARDLEGALTEVCLALFNANEFITLE